MSSITSNSDLTKYPAGGSFFIGDNSVIKNLGFIFSIGYSTEKRKEENCTSCISEKVNTEFNVITLSVIPTMNFNTSKTVFSFGTPINYNKSSLSVTGSYLNWVSYSKYNFPEIGILARAQKELLNSPLNGEVWLSYMKNLHKRELYKNKFAIYIGVSYNLK